MQVFEFYFNPKLKPDLIFETFCYEPENIYEKRVGNLYMTGMLKNVLPNKVHFLDKISKVIKEKYYSPTARSPEKSLKASLKRANNFLENLAKRGDVSWLGNLSFAICSLKNFELNLSKVGGLKIFLLRGKRIFDIDKKVKFEEIEPYPLKIFLNIVSGKLAENDIILILSKEVAQVFQDENLLTEIAQLSSLAPIGAKPEKFLDEKKLIKILENKKDKLSQTVGICLLLFLSKELIPGKRATIFPQPEVKKFSLKEVFSPFVTFFRKIKLPQIKLPKIYPFKFPIVKFPRISFPKLKFPKLRFPKLRFPKFGISARIENLKQKINAFFRSKNTILVLSLILFLIVGSFIFKREVEEQLEEYRATLSYVQEKVEQAETFLILKSPQSTKEANLLLKESWEAISPLIKVISSLPKDFREELLFLEENILGYLYEINKLTEIEEPELLFEFSPQEFIPQKMVFDEENLYFFSPFGENLFKVNTEGEGQLIQTSQKFTSAIFFDDSILFFSKPDKVINLKNDKLRGAFFLESPYPDFDFDDFSSFKFNLYFLDKKSGQIVKYPYRGGLKWDLSQLWLNPQTKRAIGSNSIVIDGSIWILNKKSIDRYYGGSLQETLDLEFFPFPKNLSKIFTSPLFAYLYLLEPAQKRLVIVNKRGEIVKQFQSELFDNLLDFAISKDGKTIWLLNGLKVYQIKP